MQCPQALAVEAVGFALGPGAKHRDHPPTEAAQPAHEPALLHRQPVLAFEPRGTAGRVAHREAQRGAFALEGPVERLPDEGPHPERQLPVWIGLEPRGKGLYGAGSGEDDVSSLNGNAWEPSRTFSLPASSTARETSNSSVRRGL